jgi:pyridoxamine 5'-phosphate oxidase
VTDEAGLAEGLDAWLRALPVFAGALPGFDTASAPPAPEPLFVSWLQQAVATGESEPHATTLSTIDADGLPDSRVLLLKDVRDERWWFAFSAASAKGDQLRVNSGAALCFHWKSLGRQIRLRGEVQEASEAEAARDFARRTFGSKVIALASRQSTPLASEFELDETVVTSRAALERQPDLSFPSWRLYGLRPRSVEFWQARADRRHLRLAYSRAEAGWTKTLLWP